MFKRILKHPKVFLPLYLHNPLKLHNFQIIYQSDTLQKYLQMNPVKSKIIISDYSLLYPQPQHSPHILYTNSTFTQYPRIIEWGRRSAVPNFHVSRSRGSSSRRRTLVLPDSLPGGVLALLRARIT